MTKLQLAEWVATISARLSPIKRTKSEWVSHYMLLDINELRDIYHSYGC
jgi:hypothetical protein